MSTLLMRFAAPMQSWGIQSHFSVRDTAHEPSKSGVIGLLCAALGRQRSADLSDLVVLRMGTRVDRPGFLARDFHIVQDVLQSVDSMTTKNIITNRYYLADAAFLVGLQGNNALLKTLQNALRNPVWQLYLGRKAFVPSLPVYVEDGLREDQNIEEAFADAPWVVDPPQKAPEKLQCVIDDPCGSSLRDDVPISFEDRTFRSRRVSVTLIPAPSCKVKEEV